MYLKDPNDKETLEKVRALLAGLPADQKKYFRVIDRAKMDAVGANPVAVMALSGENGGSFNGSMKGKR
ncbi:hypothetical protein ACQ86N_26010 [Puia sp. P3]|uniref:hypothetical protein n=1 Tax=Puia sp. P3 TaxID=3423952 RepID=UPI003D66EA4C